MLKISLSVMYLFLKSFKYILFTFCGDLISKIEKCVHKTVHLKIDVHITSPTAELGDTILLFLGQNENEWPVILNRRKSKLHIQYLHFISVHYDVYFWLNIIWKETFYACVLCSPGNDENKDSKMTSSVSIYLYACLFGCVHMWSTVMAFGGWYNISKWN